MGVSPMASTMLSKILPRPRGRAVFIADDEFMSEPLRLEELVPLLGGIRDAQETIAREAALHCKMWPLKTKNAKRTHLCCDIVNL
jgi:hypothetical protein